MLDAPSRLPATIASLGGGSTDSVLAVVLALAGIGSVTVFALGALALRRRRSTPYLLIVGALGALVGRTLVGLGEFFGVIAIEFHHVIEHGLDVVIAVLLLLAIYAVGPATTRSGATTAPDERDSTGGSE